MKKADVLQWRIFVLSVKNFSCKITCPKVLPSNFLDPKSPQLIQNSHFLLTNEFLLSLELQNLVLKFTIAFLKFWKTAENRTKSVGNCAES